MLTNWPPPSNQPLDHFMSLGIVGRAGSDNPLAIGAPVVDLVAALEERHIVITDSAILLFDNFDPYSHHHCALWLQAKSHPTFCHNTLVARTALTPEQWPDPGLADRLFRL